LTCRDLIREKPCLVPTTLVLVRASESRPPGYKKACSCTSYHSHQRVHLSLSAIVSSLLGLTQQPDCHVPGGGAARLPRRGGGRPADGPWPAEQPPPVGPEHDPCLHEPRLAPHLRELLQNTPQGQQGAEPMCSVLARQCPSGCRDTCYVHCPSCKLVCRKPLTAFFPAY
jgi:hypothetical protein